MYTSIQRDRLRYTYFTGRLIFTTYTNIFICIYYIICVCSYLIYYILNRDCVIQDGKKAAKIRLWHILDITAPYACHALGLKQAQLVLLHFKAQCATPDDIAWQQRLAALVTSHPACNMRSDTGSGRLYMHTKYFVRNRRCETRFDLCVKIDIILWGLNIRIFLNIPFNYRTHLRYIHTDTHAYLHTQYPWGWLSRRWIQHMTWVNTMPIHVHCIHTCIWTYIHSVTQLPDGVKHVHIWNAVPKIEPFMRSMRGHYNQVRVVLFGV
jgi:hypothetical protein